MLNRRTSNRKQGTFSVMFSCTFFNCVKRIVCAEFTNIRTLRSSVTVEFWVSSKAVDCSRDIFLISSRVSFSILVKYWINSEWWSFRRKNDFVLGIARTCTYVTDTCKMTYRTFSNVARLFFLHFNSKFKFSKTIRYLNEERYILLNNYTRILT